MKLKQTIRASILVAVAAVAGTASAGLTRFTLTGDYSATWELDTSVTPSDSLNGSAFVLWNVAGTFDGSATQYTDLTFFSTSSHGGLNIYDFSAGHNLLATNGPQLYTGSESSPTFVLGTFTLSEFRGTGSYTLTVADVAAVPEPGSLALALAGLTLLYAARRARQGMAVQPAKAHP